jgi:hypothetical protein
MKHFIALAIVAALYRKPEPKRVGAPQYTDEFWSAIAERVQAKKREGRERRRRVWRFRLTDC